MDNFKKDLNVHDSEQEENVNEDALYDNDYKVSKDQIKHKIDNTTNLLTKFQYNEAQEMKRKGEENKQKGQSKNMDEEKEWKKDEQESSIHLCEELKSILIATQISALKGDYKKGKRLNMKKIINYRKDKIWLRRKQPQKRTFQILLALDDSLSMSENQVGYLSLQSLTSLSLDYLKRKQQKQEQPVFMKE